MGVNNFLGEFNSEIGSDEYSDALVFRDDRSEGLSGRFRAEMADRGMGALRPNVGHPLNRTKYEMVVFSNPSTVWIVRRWFYHLGGLGLILFGLDSSAIPILDIVDASDEGWHAFCTGAS